MSESEKLYYICDKNIARQKYRTTNTKIMKSILSDIIGREKEIQDLRLILESSSVVMSSTRRMGKTMIMTKMNEMQHPGIKAMLCFIESVQSAEEFVNVLRENLIEQGLLKPSDFTRVMKWLNDTMGKKDVGFFKTPDFTRHWKTILNLMVDDLVEKHAVQIILMLDEFPKMLWNLIQNGSHQQAEEILDEMRNIREKHEKRSKLRFIYCGSIGMNLVINHLVEKFNYTGAPLNNMFHYIVQEMKDSDAHDLVEHLVTKNNLTFPAELTNYLAKSCSYLPFFIDRIITQLKLSFNSSPVTQSGIDETIRVFISGRENNNQFNHFTERLDAYYDEKDKRIAYEILRMLSKANEPMDSSMLMNNVKLNIVSDDFEISKILTDLYSDMYVDRFEEGDAVKYSFRYELLKKWWKLNYA